MMPCVSPDENRARKYLYAAYINEEAADIPGRQDDIETFLRTFFKDNWKKWLEQGR
jgi:hypothetical protein